MEIYKVIPKDFYRDFAANTKLNQFLRAVFSEIDNKETCHELTRHAESLRDALVDVQLDLMSNVRYNVLGCVPLFFVRNNTRADGKYIRWRTGSYSASNTGDHVLDNALKEPKFEPQIKLNLISAERERLILNMQMRLFTDFVQEFKKLDQKFDALDKLEQELMEKVRQEQNMRSANE